MLLDVRGTSLFGETFTAPRLRDYVEQGSILQDVTFKEALTAGDFHAQYPHSVVLFLIHRNGRIEPVTDQSDFKVDGDQTVILLGPALPAPAMPADGTAVGSV